MTDSYDKIAFAELTVWKQQMLQKPSVFSSLSKRLQTKINGWIPEKVHNAITTAIKQMIKGVLFGASFRNTKQLKDVSLEERETEVRKKIDIYRKTAAVEGGITGAGGILLGMVDFPVLLGIKIKLLFDIVSLYGYDVSDYKERVYLLHIFELAFSSDEHRKNIFLKMDNWEEKSKQLPEDINSFDWRTFQQEYRDYIDLAKIAQLLPVIGAPIGVLVNHRLIRKLGMTAMNAYRLRIEQSQTVK